MVLMKTRFSLVATSVLGLVFGLGLAAGCSDDEKGTCSSAAAAICEAACDCGGSAGCSIGDADGSITLDNKSDCLRLYAFACDEQPSGGADYAACEAALASPTCVPSGDGMALMVPAACEEE
jgi:hypothetical protein